MSFDLTFNNDIKISTSLIGNSDDYNKSSVIFIYEIHFYI